MTRSNKVVQNQHRISIQNVNPLHIKTNRMKHLFVISLACMISVTAFSQVPIEDFALDNPAFLDETVANYDVFFTAEMHWRKENNPRKMAMIKYLASKNSIDVIVVERSFDFGYWVNHYLETGDSLLLKEFLEKDNFYSTRKGVVLEDEYTFYTWLRNFNHENDLKIRVIGIDLAAFWRGKPLLWSFLTFMEMGSSLAERYGALIPRTQDLLEKNNVSVRAMRKWFNEVNAINNQIDVIDSNFQCFLLNLEQSIPWIKGNELNYRDSQIAKNFLRYVKGGEKVYGQYGLTHVALENGERIGFDTFASVLNSNERYRNKILSVGLICIGCDPDTKEDSGDFPGPDIFHHFLTQADFDRLKSEFMKLPQNTFMDLRGTDEEIKNYCQLLLVQFD